MQVMLSPEIKRKFPDCPKEIPWSMIQPFEKLARRNHGQSLKTLNARGGLSPWALYVLLHKKSWIEMLALPEVTPEMAIAFLKQIIASCG